LRVQFATFYFEDVLRPILFARNVDGDGYRAFFAARYAKDLDDIKSVATRYVIYHSAISNLRHSKLSFTHYKFASSTESGILVSSRLKNFKVCPS